MAGRRLFLKLGVLKAVALASLARHATAQIGLSQENPSPTHHEFGSDAELIGARDLAIGDRAHTPTGAYSIVPFRAEADHEARPHVEGRTVINVAQSGVMAVLDPSETVSSVEALENDARRREDFRDQVSVTTEEGFRYAVLPEAAQGFDIITRGGVTLRAMPDAAGRITARQLGISGRGNERIRLRRLIGCLGRGATNHIVIDADVNLPGAEDGLRITNADILGAATIEFLPGRRLLFDTDGSVAQSYFRVQNVANLTLIRPHVENTAVPIFRHAQAAIMLVNCDDCEVIGGRVIDTCGAGILIVHSRRCRVRDAFVSGVLADGFHITNGRRGASLDCWTYNCRSDVTGDDGFAVVSYKSGGVDPCERCGHIDFYSRQSRARGASLVGGRNCTLKGEAWQSHGPGVLVARDTHFNTYDVQHGHIDVITRNCGSRVGAASVEIGAGCDGITGSVFAFAAVHRGASIASAADEPSRNIDVTISVQDCGSDGIYISNVSGLNIRSAYANRCRSNGLVLRNSSDLTVGRINIRNYGMPSRANRGLTVQNCDTFRVGSGLLLDPSNASERPIRVNDARNGTIGAQQISGGTALVPVQITDTCQNLVYEGDAVRTPTNNFALTCAHTGPRTTTEIRNAAISEITIVASDERALPLGVPVRILNGIGRAVSVVADDNIVFIGPPEIPARSIGTLTQVRKDVWHVA